MEALPTDVFHHINQYLTNQQIFYFSSVNWLLYSDSEMISFRSNFIKNKKIMLREKLPKIQKILRHLNTVNMKQ